MPVALMFSPVMQFTDANGTPIPFAKVFSYQAGTSTPLALYQDASGVTPHTNPAIADAGGHLVAFLTIGVAYKLNVQDALGVQVPGWPVDNVQIPTQGSLSGIDDFSATEAQSNITMNPGLPGTPNLATSAAEEIQQLRFVVQRLAGTSNWKAIAAPRYKTGDVVFSSPTNRWNDAETHTLEIYFRIPADYLSGDITLNLYRRALLVTSGLARFDFLVQAALAGAVPTTILTGTSDVTAANLTILEHTYVLPTAGLTVNTILQFTLTRFGADAADTCATGFIFMGHRFAYAGGVSP